MDYYTIWCNLKDSRKDLEFAVALRAYLDRLVESGRVLDYRITRRKLGFGPPELGEFGIVIAVADLAQLDQVFGQVAARAGELERLHGAVYSLVTDFRAGLYRDFPDPQRTGTGGRADV